MKNKLLTLFAIPILIAGSLCSTGYAKAPSAIENKVDDSISDAADKAFEQALRKYIIHKAVSYEGEISYDAASHGSRLENSGFNDSSGFVSQVFNHVFEENYTTASFYTEFNPKKWDEKEVKAGDILLHYTGVVGDCQGDNALIYMGKNPSTGEPQSIECTSAGVIVRSRSDKYYEESYYISVTDLIESRADYIKIWIQENL